MSRFTRTRALAPVLAVVAGGACLLSSCSSGTELSESSIESVLAKQFIADGATGATVKCPGNLNEKAGTTYDCNVIVPGDPKSPYTARVISTGTATPSFSSNYGTDALLPVGASEAPTPADAKDTTGADATDTPGADATDTSGAGGTDTAGADATDTAGADATDTAGADATDTSGADATGTSGASASPTG